MSTGLAFSILCRNSDDFDVKQFFNCPANIGLGCQWIDFKSVLRVFLSRLPHSFFSHKRPEQNLMRLKIHFGLCSVWCRNICHLYASASEEFSVDLTGPALIASKASLVTNIFFGFKTLKALRSETDEIETPEMFRALLYTIGS